jgi:hypothetical protein
LHLLFCREQGISLSDKRSHRRPVCIGVRAPFRPTALSSALNRLLFSLDVLSFPSFLTGLLRILWGRKIGERLRRDHKLGGGSLDLTVSFQSFRDAYNQLTSMYNIVRKRSDIVAKVLSIISLNISFRRSLSERILVLWNDWF